MKLWSIHPLMLALLPAVALLVSCAEPATSSTPPLADTTQPAPPAADKKNWLDATGDAAWDAVGRPITGLVPKGRPKPAPIELTPVDPPEMVIVTRASRGVVTQEVPATTTAPATQP